MEVMTLGSAIIGSHPIDCWADFVEFTSILKRRLNYDEIEQRRSKLLNILCPNGVFVSSGLELEFEFPNGHRDPVTLPVGSVASRIGDPLIVETLFTYLPSEEIFKALLQDVADDHSRGLQSFELSLISSSRINCDEKGFAVISAVENCKNECLPSLLRWAHSGNSLSILCSHPELYHDENWHLPVYENALRISINNSIDGIENSLNILNTLLNTKLYPFPLSANQKIRIIKYAFETNDEECINALFHRFPECISKVDHMRFDKPSAESLRRRCIYRLLYEPPDTAL